MYTIRQLRDNTKEILDKAWAGESITIKRHDQEFILRKDLKDDTIQMVLKRLKALEDWVYKKPTGTSGAQEEIVKTDNWGA